jgi:hypothetical protein
MSRLLNEVKLKFETKKQSECHHDQVSKEMIIMYLKELWSALLNIPSAFSILREREREGGKKRKEKKRKREKKRMYCDLCTYSEESEYSECYFVSLGGTSLDAYQCVEDIFHHYSMSYRTHFYFVLEALINEKLLSNSKFTCSGKSFVDLYNFELVDAQRR